jgi:hypothetical protein
MSAVWISGYYIPGGQQIIKLKSEKIIISFKLPPNYTYKEKLIIITVLLIILHKPTIISHVKK